MSLSSSPSSRSHHICKGTDTHVEIGWVDLFEREVSGLGVEEVDYGEEAEVEDGEVDVGLVADVADADGGDFHDEEGEYPWGKILLAVY